MHDDVKHKVRTETFGRPTNVFELRHTKCFSQGTGYGRIFLFWNHENRLKGSKRSNPTMIGATLLNFRPCNHRHLLDHSVAETVSSQDFGSASDPTKGKLEKTDCS